MKPPSRALPAAPASPSRRPLLTGAGALAGLSLASAARLPWGSASAQPCSVVAQWTAPAAYRAALGKARAYCAELPAIGMKQEG